MAKQKLVRGADLFCGAGGTSTGLLAAAAALGYATDLLAINHWDIAIATHSLNHEQVRHLCQNLDKVDPLELVPGGRLDILVASPECTHHSNARGGKPRSDQKRADAWLLQRWVEKLYIENLLIENVKEFMNWGPLSAAGQPLKRVRGHYFDQFIRTLKIVYHLEYKVLNCADYGDPTTRERFFLMARRKGHARFSWPLRTHASPAELTKRANQQTLFSDGLELQPWRTAREDVIDWSIESKSIFDRKKPLSPNTMARIFAGLRKHSGLQIIMATGGRQAAPGHTARSVDQPIPTVMPDPRLNLFEVKPFVVKTGHKSANGHNTRSVEQPVQTVTGQNEQGLVEGGAFVMKLSHTKSRGDHTRSADAPLTTITSLQEHALIEAEIGEAGKAACLLPHAGFYQHWDNPPRSVDQPVSTITGHHAAHLVEADLTPVIVNLKGKEQSRSVDDPTLTQTAKPHQYLCEGSVSRVLINHKGKDGRSRTIDEPAFTQCAGGNHQGVAEAEITPVIVTAGGPEGQGRNARSVDEPMKTIMTDDRQGVAEASVIIHSGGPDVDGRSVDEPTRTLLAREHQALVEMTAQPLEPFIVTNNHGKDGGRNRTHDVDKPMPTVTQVDAWSVIEPYLIQFFGERDGQEPRTRSVDDPAWTVTAQNRTGLVEPEIVATDGVKGDAFLLKSYTGSDSASLDKPTPSITAKFEHLGLIENEVIEGNPNLIKFYGTAKNGQSVDTPLDAVTAKDRFGLVEPTVVRIKGEGDKKDIVGLYIPVLGIVVDIRFRMLQPPELAAAMSFPPDYQFAGNRENKVMQIGNAVPCRTAQALCTALLTKPARKPRARKAAKLKKAA